MSDLKARLGAANKGTESSDPNHNARKRVMRDTKDMRNFLTEQMNNVVTGDLDPIKAKGVSNIAQQIYNTLNIEIRMASAKSKLGDQKIEPVKFND